MNREELLRNIVSAIRAYLDDPNEGYVIRLRSRDVAELVNVDASGAQVGGVLGREAPSEVNGIRIERMEGQPVLWKFSIVK